MGSYRFKIILAGDEAVGKTSTILRFVHNTYSEMYKPTLGFQISVKNLNYKTPPPSNEDRLVIFSIWDIAGQGQFAGVRKGYYQATDGVLLLFDLTRRKTFENAKLWADEIRTVAPAAPIVLVGNKADLPNQAVLPQELTYASTENKFASYAICSAATGRGIEEIFKMVTDAIIRAISAPPAPEPEPVITISTGPVTPPGMVKVEVPPPVMHSQTPVTPVETTPPVQRHPPIIPQLEIKLPVVRNVPQASPVEAPAPASTPVIPEVEVQPVVVPPTPVGAPETPEIEPVHVPPAPVDSPVYVEPPVAPPVPATSTVVPEPPIVSQAPVGVPETIETEVPSPAPPFVSKTPEPESQPPKHEKRGFWKSIFHRN